MANWFVTVDGELKSRWTQAFTDARVLPRNAFDTLASKTDLVWVSTAVEDWLGVVRALADRGMGVIALSYQPHDREALAALDAGARGYIHTLAAAPVLTQVAVVVSHRGVWVGEELMAKVIGGSFTALTQHLGALQVEESAQLAPLTQRERLVALAVARGATNKEVARELEITERTVKAHLSAIFKKLAVRDRLQLILKLAPSV